MYATGKDEKIRNILTTICTDSFSGLLNSDFWLMTLDGFIENYWQEFCTVLLLLFFSLSCLCIVY